MRVIIVEDAKAAADTAFQFFYRQLKDNAESVLGLATGATPLPLYQKLIAAYQDARISFQQCCSFNLDEYIGLPSGHPQSYTSFMQRELFQHIDIDLKNTHLPDGNTQDSALACKSYEALIKVSGGIDLQLLGLGSNGHIGFNEPSSGLQSRTRVKTLDAQTLADNSRYFAAGEFQPKLAITMGIGTILESRQIVLIACGRNKAQAAQQMIEGPLSAICPASALQLHNNAIAILDEAAADLLQHKQYYLDAEAQAQILEVNRHTRHA